ncbi:thiamine diphosphate-binding protein [Pterulicium gracile]|uniref:Thiamine diphosphate-binding protein n=1 Tax=Pterulicium gracile TaxID=1884261 RepID=A0A5C3QPF9_9AGAR|nr:thiamine diphosphate-binding protein [Pterula gracilis]
MSSPSDKSLNAQVDRLRLELHELKQEQGALDVRIGDYLLTRLEQLGVRYIFGVPGDFNLGFLDLVEDHPTIKWVGNCNELNAAYAADGYARVKQQLGVVITTFGVGELSAINGIAGAFSEMVPVLHIVGVPNTSQQKAKPMLHHTLGDGRFDAYQKAAEQFTIAQVQLDDAETAAKDIDRVLEACITKARPAYLTVPTDIAFKKIKSDRLKIPLSDALAPNDPHTEQTVIDEIAQLVEKAQGSVVILVDACAKRHHCQHEVALLAKKTGFPVFSSPMGKTAVSETYERYGGIYVGSLSRPDIKDAVESAKLILSVGALKSDFNTGGFTYKVPRGKTVELHSTHTAIRYAVYPEIAMKELLPKLTARLSAGSQSYKIPAFTSKLPEESDSKISQAWFWPKMGTFFQPKDVLLAETGTSSFGILDVALPKDAIFEAQILWGSIGWTVGSTLGAAVAAREMGLGRTILFIGDGSLQLTVQELSTMLREGLKPIIFVLNNSGYTIERWLHGKHRKYNDIANWNWTALLGTLTTSPEVKHKSYTVHTKDELTALLEDSKFAKCEEGMQLVEVMMDQLDAPRALLAQAELSNTSNVYAEDLS